MELIWSTTQFPTAYKGSDGSDGIAIWPLKPKDIRYICWCIRLAGNLLFPPGSCPTEVRTTSRPLSLRRSHYCHFTIVDYQRRVGQELATKRMLWFIGQWDTTWILNHQNVFLADLNWRANQTAAVPAQRLKENLPPCCCSWGSQCTQRTYEHNLIHDHRHM